MMGFLGSIFDGAVWFLVTGWEIWCGLFAALPYGDPHLASAAALVVCAIIFKVFTPTHTTY